MDHQCDGETDGQNSLYGAVERRALKMLTGASLDPAVHASFRAHLDLTAAVNAALSLPFGLGLAPSLYATNNN